MTFDRTDLDAALAFAFLAGFGTCGLIVLAAHWFATWRALVRLHSSSPFRLERRGLKDTLDDGNAAPMRYVKGGKR